MCSTVFPLTLKSIKDQSANAQSRSLDKTAKHGPLSLNDLMQISIWWNAIPKYSSDNSTLRDSNRTKLHNKLFHMVGLVWFLSIKIIWSKMADATLTNLHIMAGMSYKANVLSRCRGSFPNWLWWSIKCDIFNPGLCHFISIRIKSIARRFIQYYHYRRAPNFCGHYRFKIRLKIQWIFNLIYYTSW